MMLSPSFESSCNQIVVVMQRSLLLFQTSQEQAIPRRLPFSESRLQQAYNQDETRLTNTYP